MKRASTILGAAVALLALTPPLLAAPGGFLGVYLREDDRGDDGALIDEVAPDSPAAQAGLRKGDRIVKLGEQRIPHAKALIPHLMRGEAGQALTLRVSRDGWEKTFRITLAGRPGEAAPAQPAQPAQPAREPGFLGVYLRPGAKNEPVIDGVLDGSPAAQAGLAVGDIVKTVDGRAIDDPSELIATVGRYGVGQQVKLGVERDGQAQTITVTLGHRPGEGSLPAPAQPQPRPQPRPEGRAPKAPEPAPAPAAAARPYVGVALVDDGGKGPLKVDDVAPGSPAERYGLRTGDVILAVNDASTKTIEDFVKAFQGLKVGDVATFKIERDGWRSELRMTLEAKK